MSDKLALAKSWHVAPRPLNGKVSSLTRLDYELRDTLGDGK